MAIFSLSKTEAHQAESSRAEKISARHISSRRLKQILNF